MGGTSTKVERSTEGSSSKSTVKTEPTHADVTSSASRGPSDHATTHSATSKPGKPSHGGEHSHRPTAAVTEVISESSVSVEGRRAGPGERYSGPAVSSENELLSERFGEDDRDAHGDDQEDGSPRNPSDDVQPHGHAQSSVRGYSPEGVHSAYRGHAHEGDSSEDHDHPHHHDHSHEHDHSHDHHHDHDHSHDHHHPHGHDHSHDHDGSHGQDGSDDHGGAHHGGTSSSSERYESTDQGVTDSASRDAAVPKGIRKGSLRVVSSAASFENSVGDDGTVLRKESENDRSEQVNSRGGQTRWKRDVSHVENGLNRLKVSSSSDGSAKLSAKRYGGSEGEDSPGIVIRLNNAALEKIVEYGGKQLSLLLNSAPLPDITEYPVEGYQLNLTNLQLRYPSGTYYYELQPPETVVWGFTDGEATITGFWSYSAVESQRMQSASCKGTCDAAELTSVSTRYIGSFAARVFNVQSSTSLLLRRSNDGFIYPEVIECPVMSGDVYFFIDGLGEFRESLQSKPSGRHMLPRYSDMICNGAAVYLNESFEYLKTKYEQNLAVGSDSDLRLIASVIGQPLVNDNSIDVPLKGEVKGKVDTNSMAQPMDLSSCSTSSARCVFLSEYTVNSLLFQGFQEELFKEYKQSIRAKGLPIDLTITYTEQPNVTIDGSQSACQVRGELYSETLGSLPFEARASFKSKLSGNQVYGHVDSVKAQFIDSMQPSSEVDPDQLLFFVSKAVQDQLNIFLSEYRLPLPQLQFFRWIHSSPKLMDGFQLIEDDLQSF
ncbi:hypothetical protein M514_00865 [Trichuris suis]|uniref:Uncharacterized protein n=1 Tax=Trichuris suis TaxID=68888 RepID=A0A085MVD5_9BILA|nr:hypothetical protein M514_00865 [Trichuris suis]